MVQRYNKGTHRHVRDVTGHGAITVYRPTPAQLPPLQSSVIATPDDTEAAPSAMVDSYLLAFNRRTKQLEDNAPAVWFLKMSQHSTRTAMLYTHVKYHFTYCAIRIYFIPSPAAWLMICRSFLFGSLRRLLLNLPFPGLIHNIINRPILMFRLNTPTYSFQVLETDSLSTQSGLTP